MAATRCHQLGNQATRTIPEALGDFANSAEAWERRIQSGQAMGHMTNALGRLGPERALAMFADWTDRIAGGELPPRAAAAAGRRAQRRRHAVGLGRAQGLPA